MKPTIRDVAKEVMLVYLLFLELLITKIQFMNQQES